MSFQKLNSVLPIRSVNPVHLRGSEFLFSNDGRIFILWHENSVENESFILFGEEIGGGVHPLCEKACSHGANVGRLVGESCSSSKD